MHCDANRRELAGPARLRRFLLSASPARFTSKKGSQCWREGRAGSRRSEWGHHVGCGCAIEVVVLGL